MKPDRKLIKKKTGFGMSKGILLFGVAALLNGSTWWVFVLAQASPHPSSLLQLIQLGGTGGLIIALLGAVVILWQDRIRVQEAVDKDLAEMRSLLRDERDKHRKEIAEMRVCHRNDLNEVTERYMEELQRQIQALKDETKTAIRVERDKSEEMYRRKDSSG